MKKLAYIMLFLFGVLVHAQSPGELFDKANKLYMEGEFEPAIEAYLEIETLGVESDDLFFNLGNSYYKLNEVAPSIYYYEKALKINPSHEDALFNLEFAKRMTIDAIEDLPMTFLQRFSEAVIEKLPFDSWAIIAVIASFLASFLFLLYHFSYSSRKKLFYFNTSILAVFVLILTVAFAFTSYDIEKKDKTAIIFAASVEIKNAPSEGSEEVFELHEGTKVIVLDELDDWKKIKLADGKVGWIQKEHLLEI